MLGIGCPDRHALTRITPIKCTDRELRSNPARAGSFFGATLSPERVPTKVRNNPPNSADPDEYCERQVWGIEEPFKMLKRHADEGVERRPSRPYQAFEFATISAGPLVVRVS
jgi:hypothetical protein